jgi:hypothetical protein
MCDSKGKLDYNHVMHVVSRICGHRVAPDEPNTSAYHAATHIPRSIPYHGSDELWEMIKSTRQGQIFIDRYRHTDEDYEKPMQFNRDPQVSPQCVHVDLLAKYWTGSMNMHRCS